MQDTQWGREQPAKMMFSSDTTSKKGSPQQRTQEQPNLLSRTRQEAKSIDVINMVRQQTCWTWARKRANWFGVQHTSPEIVGHRLWILSENASSGWIEEEVCQIHISMSDTGIAQKKLKNLCYPVVKPLIATERRSWNFIARTLSDSTPTWS